MGTNGNMSNQPIYEYNKFNCFIGVCAMSSVLAIKGTKTTREDLVELLEELATQEPVKLGLALKSLIEEARAGDFHCYSNKYADPKSILLERLRPLEVTSLYIRIVITEIRLGVYDEPIPSNWDPFKDLVLKSCQLSRKIRSKQ
jgi:hypothetical protein